MGCLGAAADVLCIGLDRRTGRVVESLEGIDAATPPDELHPVLRWRLTEVGARPPAHEHAPVQAVNALLWARGEQAGADVLGDFCVSATAVDPEVTSIPMCTSCMAVLRPVEDSYTTTGSPSAPEHAPREGASADATVCSASSGTTDATDEMRPSPTPDWIAHNIGTALRHLGPQVPFGLGFDRRSVAWVEGYVERMRTAPDVDATRLVPVLGSFLGQCLVETYRGTWVESNQEWAVRIPSADGVGSTDAFPFTKAHKLARDGLAGGESIVSFFDLVATLPERSRARREGPTAPVAGAGVSVGVAGSGALGPGRPATGAGARRPVAGAGAIHAPGRGNELWGEVRLDLSTLRVMVRATLGWRVWLARGIGVLALVWAAWLLLFGSDAAGASSSVAVVVALPFLFHGEVQTRLGWRHFKGVADRPWRYRVSAAGIAVVTPISQVELRWEMIRRLRRTRRVWVLTTTSRARIAIPRAAFTAHDADRIDRRIATSSMT